MTTVLYFVRNGDRNEELRYSLRSLANLPHDRVVIVGYKPRWVTGVEYVKGNRQHAKWRNVYDNLRIAARRVPGEWIVMNDDFFVTQPIESVPSWHRGLLVDHIASLGARGDAWVRSLRSTLDVLQARGIAEPLSYELHVPVRMEATRLGEVLGFAADRADLPQWRTLYGNWWKVESTPMPDVRARKGTAGWAGGPFLSTSDRVFAGSAVGEHVRALFPEPCEYERGR